MEILTRHHRVIDHSSDGYICVGTTVVCPSTGKNFEDCEIVDVSAVPIDIDEYEYYYVCGKFIKETATKYKKPAAGIPESDLDSALQSKINNTFVLLWENASPTSAFAGQTVSLGLSVYAFVAVEFCKSISDSYRAMSIAVNGAITAAMSSFSGKTMTRSLTVSATGIVFGSGQIYETYGVSVTDNGKMIPIKIYGVR